MPVYEMLWDCPYCGTRKLLGKTYRFCPGCGAPQDASRRYFPAEADKVAVEDHVYVGADRRCGACQSAMSARAQHCTQCGAPMEGAAEVARVADGAGGQPGSLAYCHKERRPARIIRLGRQGLYFQQRRFSR